MPGTKISGALRLRAGLVRWMPWLLTAGVIFWISQSYSLRTIWGELLRGGTVLVALPAVVCSVVMLLFVAHYDRWIFRSLDPTLRVRDVLVAKAGTSMLAVLGYGVGQGGYAVWLARRTHAGAASSVGALLYVLLLDLFGVALAASVATWVSGGDLGTERTGKDMVDSVRLVAPLIAFGVLCIIAVTPLLRGHKGEKGIFRAWIETPRLIAVKSAVGRACNIFILVVGTYLGMLAFGLDVPFVAAAAVVPLVLLVGALPINLAGFGAVQAAWLLLTPWEPGEAILAFQFLWQILWLLCFIARGFPFVRRVARDIAAPSGVPDPAATPPASSH